MAPKVTFVDPDGTSQTVEIVAGRSVMQGAVTNGIAGIVAECGGNAMCATCHVYVGEGWRDRLPEPTMVEQEMLEFTACERTDDSRLSCQLAVTDDLDGLTVRLPEDQL